MAEWSKACLLMVSPCRVMLKVVGWNPAECAQLFFSTPLCVEEKSCEHRQDSNLQPTE